MICPICGREFVQSCWNKRFCSYRCHDRSESLVNAKELFRLSPEDISLRNKLRLRL